MEKPEAKVVPMNRAARRHPSTQPTEVAVPVGAQPKLQQFLAMRQQAESQLTTYMQGVMDTLGLDGIWNLDVQRMVIVKVEKADSNGD